MYLSASAVGLACYNKCSTFTFLPLKDMDITWDEAEELATDRAEWRQRVAQCTIWVRDELRSKVKVHLRHCRYNIYPETLQ